MRPPAAPQEEEGDDLEDALALPRVDVAHVAELPVAGRTHARLLGDLAHRRLERGLPGVDEPLRERPDDAPARLAARPDDRDPRAASHPAHDHAAG